MPELPEVETIKKTLQRLVIGKKINNVKVHWGKIIQCPSDPQEFEMNCIGQTVHSVERRGKFLKFILDDSVLVSHLRMEGRYMLHHEHDPFQKHTHVVFSFTDGSELRYMDVRKFGTMHLFPKGMEEKNPPLTKLGVEPLSDDFVPEVLLKACEKTTRNIKAVLLDQSFVVGLGNIYVDEALFRARIHPKKIGKNVTEPEIERLHKAIIHTLSEAVEQGGSTIRSYVNSQGEIGKFQFSHLVYGKKGEPCTSCGTEIQKTIVSQRGTHFCPKCQS